MTTDTSASDRAHQAASTAADEGRHVAGTAADEAKQVAGQAAEQARSVVSDTLGQATSQANEQARAQRDRLVSTLTTLGDDLDGMAEQAPGGLATDLTRQAAEKVRALGTHLDGRDPNDMLEDVRRFARQRPGTFLLGALAAGVAAGRLLRGAGDGAAGAAAMPHTPATMPSTTTATTPPATGAPTAYAAPAGGPLAGGPTHTTGTAAAPAGTATTNPPMPTSTPGQPTQPTRDALSGDETGYSGGGLSSEDRL